MPHRPVEDMAFAVARFVQKGGSFVNYYMVSRVGDHGHDCHGIAVNASTCSDHLHVTVQYHGGTNFGRTAGGPFIATSYDYDAPIDEYGMR